jgi:hypothetical protein
MENPTLNEILESNSASYWLKNALTTALNRDILDAAKDAELLAVVLLEPL